MSSARPGGALHVRPWRPRPARCSPAVTSVPCGAPAAASARASVLVESVHAVMAAAACRAARVTTDTGAIRISSSSVEPERGERRTAVDGERQRAVAVLVEQQLAGGDVGERRRVVRASPADHDRLAAPQPGRGEVLVLGVEHDVAVAVGVQHVGDQPVGGDVRAGQLEPHERRRVERLADLRERALPAARCAATGAKMSRP